jgi:hypothetical protein
MTCLGLAAALLLSLQEDVSRIDPKLKETFTDFSRALRAGEKDKIEPFLLEQAVDFVTEPRASLNYGPGIHLPFATTGFDATIMSSRVLGRGRVFLRTNSSCLYFVETRDDGWKLYAYRDKPIR